MRNLFKAILLLPICLAASSGSAKSPYHPIEGNVLEESWRWTELEVLSPYVVRQASRAPDGILWLAVHGGVVAYDGYAVTPYMFGDIGWQESNTLSIHVSSSGIVYVVTKDFGACLVDGEWIRLFETHSIGYSSGSRIGESSDGSIWFATPSGLFRVRGQDTEIVELDSTAFSAVSVDSLNRLWLSDLERREILCYTLDGVSGLPKSLVQKIPITGVSGQDFIVEFAIGAEDRMWIASNSSRQALVLVQNGQVSDILENWSEFGPTNRYLLEREDGSLWVITQALFAVYNEGDWTFNSMEGRATWFSFVYPYDKDTLILGGHTDKTYRFDASDLKWKSFEGLNFNCRDLQGRDWFIDQRKQIVYYDSRTDEWFVFNASDNIIDQPTRIICTKDGYLFASGSHQGKAAVCWNIDGRWSMRVHADFSTTIAYNSPFEGNDGILYFGADFQTLSNDSMKGGILKYWVESQRVDYAYEHPPAVPKRVLHITQTPDQRLWISSGASLMVKDGNHRAEYVSEKYIGNWIDDIAVDSGGHLWVLAWKTGLARQVEDKWESFILPGQSRMNKTATLFAGEGDENIWVALNEGLNRFDGNNWFEFARLPELNLKREECKIIGSSDGSLWINIATPSWYGNMQELDSYANEPYRTVHYLADDLPPETEIVSAEDSIIESGNALIEWTGIDAWSETRPGNLHYSYRINGGPWSPYQTDPKALLTSVTPGKYVFEVRARDLDWNVDPTPATFNFTVVPFIWKQPWFILMVLAVLVTIIGLIVYIVRLRVRHIIAIEEFKIDFFTNISHELRTPLSAIIGPLESMLKKPAAEPLKGSLDMVYRNARRMLGLVNQLLEFRKVELGKLKYEPVRSDLILFLKDVVYAHAALWERKQQEFNLESSHGHSICCFDPEKLQHIVTNLISNAIKYTPENGRIEVSINVGPPSVNRESSDNGAENAELAKYWLYLDVTDTGIGIARERQELIFKPFYRERDQDRNQEGTGIGLAYTFELVKLWGGTIEVESPLEIRDGSHRGTRFHLSLPLIECEEQNELISSFLDEPLQPELQETENPQEDSEDVIQLSTILIVDDNADIRAFLEAELSELYKIFSAENGEEGLSVAREIHPDLILADLMMPVMDGLEMCSHLKTDPETSHIPILMLTARGSDEFRIKGIEHGADDYYSKPVNIELLKARMKSLMDSRRLLRERFTRQVLILPEEITVTPVDEQFLRKAIQIVQDHMRDEDFDVEAFSREMGMGRASVYRKMNAIVGEPPFKFIRSIRLKRAAQLLESGNYNVSETMEMTGINGLSHFGKIFREEYGMSPSEYRAKHVSDEGPIKHKSSIIDELF